MAAAAANVAAAGNGIVEAMAKAKNDKRGEADGGESGEIVAKGSQQRFTSAKVAGGEGFSAEDQCTSTKLQFEIQGRAARKEDRRKRVVST